MVADGAHLLAIGALVRVISAVPRSALNSSNSTRSNVGAVNAFRHLRIVDV